jgi:hypothetical protein
MQSPSTWYSDLQASPSRYGMMIEKDGIGSMNGTNLFNIKGLAGLNSIKDRSAIQQGLIY